MSDQESSTGPSGKAGRIERELMFLQQKICSLISSENESVALRACKLYYDVLCDEEALDRDGSRQHGRPLQIIFRGKEMAE